MHKVNIQSLDLNLLIALKALLEEKHVSRAAERIGLSQPAMSRSLGRLRAVFKDPLLVKGTGGLSLTARANELLQPLNNIFSEITHLMTPPTLNPASMQGEIVISTRDYEIAAILPQVINHVANVAPGLSLRIIPLVGDDLDVLQRHEADLIISGTDTKSGSLYRQLLYHEDFVCLVSAKNPVLKKGLNLQHYVAMKHCVVSITGYGPGVVDTLLEKKGLKREVTVRMPHFTAASYIVAGSNLIVTLPRRMGLIASQQKNLVMLEPPITIPSFSIYLYWHVRNQNNPVHQWLRKIIREHCQKKI